MRKTLIAAAGLLALGAVPAAAAAPQERPYHQDRSDRGGHDNDRGRHDGNRGRIDNDWNNRGGFDLDDNRFGHRDNRWSARPGTPPRHFARADDWHRHVRACQARYRSYNPRTDMFVVRRGRSAICRL